MTPEDVIVFANPFLVCEQCGRRAAGMEGGRQVTWNWPCGHAAPITSDCPSWSPVDGCRCREMLGSIDHPPAQPDPT